MSAATKAALSETDFGMLPRQKTTWVFVKMKLSYVGGCVARGKEPFRCNWKSQCLRWGPKEGKSWRGEAACGVRARGCLLAACFLVAVCSLEQEQPTGSGDSPPGPGLKPSFDSVSILITSVGLFKAHASCKLLNLPAHCRLDLQLPFPC